MNRDLLAPYRTEEAAAAALISETEAYLANLRRHRFLRALGRLTLDGLVAYGSAMSGYGALHGSSSRNT